MCVWETQHCTVVTIVAVLCKISAEEEETVEQKARITIWQAQMAAQQVDQISVWSALRIKRRSDFEGHVVTSRYYYGFSSDGLVGFW